ncbi:MoaD/ThiS family protein [Dyella jiangningensis]|uniref:Molybdopterin synthase sulfur carrier subunit n=1 Tax=Dyella jiangningensis TaxID=1379159 RepID=A0A328PBL3_9GAMM|nr:MoaD/ThiS family protein [Dyella jiangningensis]RAO77735.1 molybdopterin synthase sulfur carrier subunit [Dyella jiangningensis]
MTVVNLQYYAQLREQAGASSEQLHTAATSLQELYEELRTRHGFSLAAEALKVAVNAQFSAWDRPLRDGDTIVFIPPVAGG